MWDLSFPLRSNADPRAGHQLKDSMIIPPYAGVRLVEYQDRIRLTPYYWVREFVGYGRYRADRPNRIREVREQRAS